MFCVHTYLACAVSQATAWSEPAAAMYLYREERNGQNMRNVFGACSTMEFVKDTTFFASEIIQNGSGFNNFVRTTKSDFEISLQKLSPESKEQIQNIAEQLLPQSD
jgi:hypothetical protein